MPFDGPRIVTRSTGSIHRSAASSPPVHEQRSADGFAPHPPSVTIATITRRKALGRRVHSRPIPRSSANRGFETRILRFTASRGSAGTSGHPHPIHCRFKRPTPDADRSIDGSMHGRTTARRPGITAPPARMDPSRTAVAEIPAVEGRPSTAGGPWADYRGPGAGARGGGGEAVPGAGRGAPQSAQKLHPGSTDDPQVAHGTGLSGLPQNGQ
jgi:hypothetical protein